MSTELTIFIDGTDISFSADPRQSVLDSAIAAGVRLPHNCRSGICGTCKATVMEGELDDSDGEDFALTDTEHANNVRLLCQSVPISGVIRVRTCLPVSVSKQSNSPD